MILYNLVFDRIFDPLKLSNLFLAATSKLHIISKCICTYLSVRFHMEKIFENICKKLILLKVHSPSKRKKKCLVHKAQSVHCNAGPSVHCSAKCTLKCQVYTAVPSVHYNAKCTLQCQVYTKMPSAHCSAKCTLQCQVYTAVPSVHCSAKCTLQCQVYTVVPSVHCNAKCTL